MKVYIFKRTQHLHAPIEAVFSFFQSPENLALITPPSLNFQILTPSPVEMRAGALIDYTIDVAGFPVRWTTAITEYDIPTLFVDQQIKGPYSFWHHTHSFADKGGFTEMRDEVRYVLPFGILGRIAHALFVKRQLEKIFDYRANVIASFFPAYREPMHFMNPDEVIV